MTAILVSTGGDIIYRGPIEQAPHQLRTRTHADRVVREDGVLLATSVPYSTALLWSMNGDAGKPRCA